MLKRTMNFVKKNKTTQLVLVFVLGVGTGAVFYPTRRIEEKLEQKHQVEVAKIKDQHSKLLKQEQEKLVKQQEELREYKSETEKRITSLTSQVKELRSKKITTYYKIVHPDGTVEVKSSSETDVEETQRVVTQVKEEFKQKLQEVEKRWEKAYSERLTVMKKTFDSKEQEYKKEIEDLKKSKVEETNKKTSSIAVGVLSSRSYYLQSTHDIFGPVFLAGQVQLGTESPTFGLGVGIRF